MPVTVTTSSIKASGGTYSTILLWEADTDIDLVAGNFIHIGDLYDETYDETPVIAGATTDIIHYRELRAHLDEEHKGVFGAGARVTGAHNGITISENYFRMTDIEVNVSGDVFALSLATAYMGVIVDRCLFKTTGGSNTAEGCVVAGNSAGSDTATIRDSVIWQARATANHGFKSTISDTSLIYLKNVTEYGNGLGTDSDGCGIYAATGEKVKLENVVACNNGGSDFYKSAGSWAAGSDYNCSEDATAPGANSLVSKTLTQIAFTAVSSGDFQPLVASVLKDEGEVIAGYILDCHKRARGGYYWDIGAFECAPQYVMKMGDSYPSAYSIPAVSQCDMPATLPLVYSKIIDRIGGRVSEPTLGAQMIRVIGSLTGSTQEAVRELVSTLRAGLLIGQTKLWVFDDRYLDVECQDCNVLYNPYEALLNTPYTATFLALSPAQYSLNAVSESYAGVVSGATIRINNRGNLIAYPTITILAAGTNLDANVVLVNNTLVKTFTYEAGVGAGWAMVLNMDAFTLLVNSANALSGMANQAEWWGLDPGENLLSFTWGGAGTATITVSYTPRWL